MSFYDRYVRRGQDRSVIHSFIHSFYCQLNLICNSNVNKFKIDSFPTKGKLGFDEFTQLWKNIRQWCAIFKKHDTDSSNTISAHELKAAFHELGLQVNRRLLQLLVHRYGIIPKQKDPNPEKGLTFDDFIHSSMKLKHAIDIWTEKAKSVAKPSTPGKALPFSYTRSSPTAALPVDPTFTLEEVSYLSNDLNFKYKYQKIYSKN